MHVIQPLERTTARQHDAMFCAWRSLWSSIASLGQVVMLVMLGTVNWIGSLPADEVTPTANTQVETTSEHWTKVGWPLLQKYCIDCHNADYSDAELDLSPMATLAGVEASGVTMQRVLDMVRFGAMPPEDVDVPSDDERRRLVEAIDKTLYAVSCDLRPRAGKVTARRLNRTEYNHAVRDLFGIDLRPADAFPSDDVGGGFDNNGDLLSLSPMLVEKYLTAAEEVSRKVVVDPKSFPSIDEDIASDRLVVVGESRTGSFFGRFLSDGAFAWAEYNVPSPGEYRIRLGGGASQESKSESDKADDRYAAGIFDMHGRLLGVARFKYYGGSGDADFDEVRVKLEGGLQRLIVLPVSDPSTLKMGEVCFPHIDLLAQDKVDEQRKSLATPLKPDTDIDMNQFPFMVRRVRVAGPSAAPSDWYPPHQKKILKRVPSRKGRELVNVHESAMECLTPLMRIAFRGPVDQEDVEPYARLVEQAVERDESFYRGIQIAISAVLVSPRFLFRIETPGDASLSEALREDADASQASDAPLDLDLPLNQHQLATRLSFFLWSSTPDAALLDLADRGKLTEEELVRQVRRMLTDSKSDSLATEFAAQWLGLRNLAEFEPDPDRFPGVDEALLRDMRRETELLFMHLVRENRPVGELLSADYTFLNERLAKHYGIEGVAGSEFRQVSLAAKPRRGVLSHASVLTLTSNPTRTSPVKRGKWILESVLGTPPPDPPPGVPELEETKTAAAGASLREQLELHRESPSCAACHRVMDQLGFGLEQFDAVGRFREQDAGHPINASGELPGGRSFQGAKELCEVLATSEQPAFIRTTVERLMTFALGRELSPTDRCTVDDISARLKDSEGRFEELVLEIVRSRQFQYFQWSGPSS